MPTVSDIINAPFATAETADSYVLGVKAGEFGAFRASDIIGVDGTNGTDGANGADGANGSPGAVVAFYLQQTFGGF